MQQWTVQEPWLEMHCSLGEGPFYEKETNTVRFVDIKQKRLHFAPLDQGLSSVQTIELDVPVSVTSDIEGVDPRERILIGVKYGLAVLDRKTGTYELLARFHEHPNERLRSNDGASDPHGKFWLGSMTDFPGEPAKVEGSLFRFGASFSSNEEVISDLIIPNSVGWSPDQSIMYFTDTIPKQVLAFDYDASTGAVSNRRVHYQHKGTGGPDGFRVDSEGNIWHAVYGESRVLKLDPQGQLIGEILLPTRNITCVQFVGTELVITTAADENGEGRSKELGGAVFRVDVGTTGLDMFKYKM